MIKNLNHFARKSLKTSAFSHLKPPPNTGINLSCTFGPRQRAHFRWYAAANGRLRKVQISVGNSRNERCNDHGGFLYTVFLCINLTQRGWQPFLVDSPWNGKIHFAQAATSKFKFEKVVWYLDSPVFTGSFMKWCNEFMSFGFHQYIAGANRITLACSSVDSVPIFPPWSHIEQEYCT